MTVTNGDPIFRRAGPYVTTRFTPIAAAWRADLWLVHLDGVPEDAELATLSAAEYARGNRFVFAHDRNRYLSSHAALRQLLASHNGVPAAELEFALGPNGKPTLAGPGRTVFNMSRSGATAVIAIAEHGAVGVDVELLREVSDVDALISEHFTPMEQSEWRTIPIQARAEAFLTGWTRKEACAKAVGCGLTLPLESFDVGLAPSPRLVQMPLADGDVRVRLGSLVAATGHVVSWADVVSTCDAADCIGPQQPA